MSTTLADRIRSRLAALDLDMKSASRKAGLGDTFVRDVIARGRSPRADAVVKLAAALEVSADWLLTGEGEQRPTMAPNVTPSPKLHVPNASPAVPVSFRPGTLSMMGHGVAGIDGRFVLNGQKIMDVMCPPQLIGVPDAYGVFVHGGSMEPRYFSGEAVFVNPHVPVRQGNFVVAQIAGDFEDDDISGFVKRFVSMNSDELVLEQFQPREDAQPDESEVERYRMRFPRDRVVAVHKILASGEV